ncbi:MAG: uroporphyrinogen decarboxylase, partial [Acetobacteraceae bacterium]|nr:uroporphyrinogen decarboxylase [Acetobacteraceae bacterium]
MANPVARVLAGEALWPPPIWLMRQAGRYLPEYRKVRSQAGDFISLCTTPALAAEVTLQPVRRYGFDAGILFSDILMLPWALGWGLAFQEGEGPVLPRFEDERDLQRLDPVRAPAAIAPILETVERCRAGLPDSVDLIGFAGSPFTVACYMVEGGGSKEFARIRGLAHGRPSVLQGLIDRLTASTVDYLSAQVAAGAQVLMLFDSWAGVLSPLLFRRHVIEPTRRIVAALRERHPAVPVVGFPRLAGVQIGAY